MIFKNGVLDASIQDLFDLARGLNGSEVAQTIAHHLEPPGYSVLQAHSDMVQRDWSRGQFIDRILAPINGRRNVSRETYDQCQEAGQLIVASNSFAFLEVEYPDSMEELPDVVDLAEDYDEQFGVAFYGYPVVDVEHFGLYVSSGATAMAWHWRPDDRDGGTLRVIGSPSDRLRAEIKLDLKWREGSPWSTLQDDDLRAAGDLPGIRATHCGGGEGLLYIKDPRGYSDTHIAPNSAEEAEIRERIEAARTEARRLLAELRGMSPRGRNDCTPAYNPYGTYLGSSGGYWLTLGEKGVEDGWSAGHSARPPRVEKKFFTWEELEARVGSAPTSLCKALRSWLEFLKK